MCFLLYAKFEVQRSIDGRNYTTINTFEADQLRCKQPFNFIDRNVSGTLFYRIKVGDLDGRFSASKIVAVTGKENISDYKNFYKTNPALSWVLTIALFSLAGVPPTAGFFGKFFLLMAGAGKGNYVLITIAALNMIISFYYYLRIVKAILMDANDRPIEALYIPAFPKIAMYICIGGIVLTGLVSYVYEYIQSLVPGVETGSGVVQMIVR